jgi:hypothetical protein
VASGLVSFYAFSQVLLIIVATFSFLYRYLISARVGKTYLYIIIIIIIITLYI